MMEFVEAVFRREHLQEEFDRAASAAERLCEGLPMDAVITVLANYRSFLEETAARLDVAEQTVSALLPEARQLLEAEQAREAAFDAREDSDEADVPLPQADGPHEDDATRVVEPASPETQDSALFSEETAVVDVSGLEAARGQTAFYGSFGDDSREMPDGAIDSTEIETPPREEAGSEQERISASADAPEATDAAISDLAGPDLSAVDDGALMDGLDPIDELSELDAHWSEVPDSAVIADTLSPDSPLPTESGLSAEAAAAAFGTISEHRTPRSGESSGESANEACGISESDVMSLLRNGDGDAVTAIVPRTTLEGVGSKRASDFWGETPSEEPIRAPELAGLSDIPDFDEDEGDNGYG